MATTTTTPAAATDRRSTPERVAVLRELSSTDPVAAQDAAWGWFERLGRLAAGDREDAARQLSDLFGCGRPSQGIDGPTDGILVAPLIHPRVDAVARRITSVWMPWMGKRFDASAKRGDNRLVGSTRWVARLLWPRYATRAAADGRLAFDFENRIERGAIEPDVDVLVIDYAPIEDNPDLIIRRIRDELVEIVPGAHLGRILWHQGEGRYGNIGYFALRTPVG
jgi:hypothetical protein